MSTASQELLDRLALSFGEDSKASDYRLAKSFFHISPQKVSQWRRGVYSFGDERVVEICEFLWPGDDDAKAHWLARVHADREQNVAVKSVWERLAKKAAAAVIVVGLAVVPLADAHASGASATAPSIYYAQFRRWLRRLVSGLSNRNPHPGAATTAAG